MILRGRRKKDDEEEFEEAVADPQPEPLSGAWPRPDGPWDVAEVDVDAGEYLDLGGILIKRRNDLKAVQVKGHEKTGEPIVLLATEDAFVELWAFAAPRSGGLWDELRPELIESAKSQEGAAEEVEGCHGPELRVQVPAKMPDGRPGVQPSRIVGIEGPRWLLRAKFYAKAALEPDDDGVLESAVREVVVVRGSGPMAPREQIPIVIPADAVPTEPQNQSDSAGA